MTGNTITITIKILVQFSGCLITYWFSSPSAFYKGSNTNTNTAQEQGKYTNTNTAQEEGKYTNTNTAEEQGIV